MKIAHIKSVARMISVLGMACYLSVAGAVVLDDSCVVNILNRTVQVNVDGGWSMPNVPSQMGRVRARATCTKAGETFSGESEYFNVIQNSIAQVPEIKFQNIEPVPVSLKVTEPVQETLAGKGLTAQLKVIATYRDASTKDVSASTQGINYTSSNPAIATVNTDGLVTSVTSGTVLITARKDEVSAFKRIVVTSNGDTDSDGLPDDFEIANGLNPNDPLDAQEDPDQDGLTSKQEYLLGTNIKLADSDGDGINDGDEVNGKLGFKTNPLEADSDGDGVNDLQEIKAGYNPLDKKDGGGRSFVELVVTPSNPTMTFNAVYNEANLQVKVSGKRNDGSLVDLTSRSTGTNYSSSNLSVLSFGAKDGLLFAGQAGKANLTVKNAGLEKIVEVTVGTFNPTALSSITIPGYANNVDVAGDYAFVAAGSKGLQIVDISNHASPKVVASYDTDGTTVDVRVVGNLVYLADGDSGMQILDITDPTKPLLLASYETAGFAQDVKIDNQYAYIADGNAGLEIVDVRKPKQPLAAGLISDIGEVKGVDAQGNTVVAVAASSVYVIDVSNKNNPVRKGSLSLGPVKDVALKDNYAYIAAYTSGWKVVDITDPENPAEVAGRADFTPRDIELTDGFAFAAEQLFRTFAVYVNIEDPVNAIFQGTIDLSRFGSHYGTGLALDSNYLYLTGENSPVAQDFGTDGTTHLLIAQYRLVEDKGAVEPTISITEPVQDASVVEGKSVNVTVTADDDIGVKSVTFMLNGTTAFIDTTRPYQFPITIPFGSTGSSVKVSAKATDFGGNSKTTADLSLNVQVDTDHDGLSDAQEIIFKSNPAKPDSDGDGISDGDEVDLKTNPIKPDSDADGVNDGVELKNGTDPLNPDVTPPVVSSTAPENNAKDIAENTPVVFSFSEPLQAKSVRFNSVTMQKGLLEGGAVIAGKIRLSSDGLQLIFTPNALLEDFTEYKVIVDGVRDRAGNPIASAFSMHYKTGNVLDVTPPTVSVIDPTANSTNIPVNAVIAVRFSEPVKAETITDQSVIVYDNVTNQPIPGILSLSGDGQSVSFVPNRAFAVGRRHQIYLTNAITDLFANRLGATYFYFTTAFDKDATGPKITDFSVASGQTAVPTNVQLQVQFDEAVSNISINNVELRKGSDVIAVTRELSGDHKTLTLKLSQPLSPSTAYSVHVEGVEDLSGNVLASSADRSFTTGVGADLTASSLVQYSPAHNVSNVGLNSKIVVEFNERLNPLTVNSDAIAIYDSVTGQRAASTQAISSDGKTVTVTPAAALTANRQYYIYVSNWAYIYDQAGNRMNYTYWPFTTGSTADKESPVLSGQNIADGASNIAVNSKLRFALDEAISNFSVAGSVHLKANGVDVSGTVALGSDNRTLTFTPTSALSVSTSYTVVVDGLYDYSGNKLAVISSKFTTGSNSVADTQAPGVSITPAYGATGVSVTSPIVMTFSEAIDPTTFDSGINITANGYSGKLAGSYSRSGNVVTFTPLTPMPGNTQFTVYINGVLDLAGNSNSYAYSVFTTGVGGDSTAPTLVSISPSDGSLDVSVNSPIVLTFSESLNQSTVNGNSIALFVNNEAIRPSFSYSGDTRTITLNASLPAASVISVILSRDIQDLSGNRLSDSVKVFTTAAANDNTRPSIVTALPGSGAYNVLAKNKIVLYSSEPLNSSSVQKALHVSQNGVLVNGTAQVIGDGRTLVYTPAQVWNKAALIEVFLDSTATDTAGNALNSYHGSFTVEEDSAQKTPYAIAVNTDDSVTLPLNPALDIQFNEALDASTVNSDVFVLHDIQNYPYQQIPVTVSLLKGNRVVRLVPKALLQASHQYYIGVRSGLKDATSVASTYNSDTFWYFTTGQAEDSIAPKVLALSPTSGAQNVGINNRINVRFDESVSPISFLGADADLPLAQPTQSDARSYSLNFSDKNRQVNYIPHEPWAANSDVTVKIATQEDYAGHTVQSASSTFHTLNGPDTTGPSIEAWSMVNNATDVPVNAVFKARLNEAVDPITVTDSSFYLYDHVTGQHVAASMSVSNDGRTLTLVPAQALAVGRDYTFYVYYGIQDLNGNSVGYYQYHTFKTSMVADNTAPKITGYSIDAGQTAVPMNPQIQVQFDEALTELSLSKVALRKGSAVVPVIPELSGDHKTLTLKLSQPLSPSTAYSVHVEGVEDLSGNVLASSADRSFTTGVGADLTASSLVQYSPAHNVSNVGLNSKIVVEFNERLNPLTVNSDAIAIYDSVTGQRAASTQAISSDGKTVTVTPAAALTANRQYYIYVSNWAYIYDQAGNRMNYTYWYFTAGAS